MDVNSAALQAGRAKLKQLVRQHINGILLNALDQLVQSAADERVRQGHNMTGNTVNAYAGGLFVDGRLNEISLCNPGHGPIRVKLRAGEKFIAGRIRWDGDMQDRTFEAKVDTDATAEPSAAISFIQSYKPQPDGWEIVVTNGVEYATYQETSMGIDVLTSAFGQAQSTVDSHFKPIQD